MKRKTNQQKPSAKTYDYTVEKKVQINGSRETGFLDKFPFEIMQPGDSFLIPAKDSRSKNPNTLHYAATQYARIRPGFTITTRQQLDKSRRVWRIK